MARRRKSNPLPIPKGKKVKVNWIRINPKTGAVDMSVPQSSLKKNVRKKVRKNVQGGYTDATGFHPFRSSVDYDPDRAGDDYGARTDNKGFKRSTKKAGKAKARKRR